MNLDPEIRDQAYQFFIEEAPDLLEAIETGLINLHTDVSAPRLHNIMRAAHSIKGGAAGVGLPGIKSLAHRLETIVKALYSDQVQLDTTLENQLLQAYDCLRFPLETQIDQGDYDEAEALATAEPIFQEIEERLGPALAQADNFLPSSSELGVDMVAALFEVDVLQGLDRLQQVVAQPQEHELIGELQAQMEVFSGFAEILNLPGFGKICEVANRAAALNPGNIIAILQQSILDFTAARELVLAGDRDQGGAPSSGLLALAQLDSAPIFPELDSAPVADDSTLIPVSLQEDYDLSDIFGESLSDHSDNNDTSLQIGADDYDLSEILDEPIADTDSQTGADDYDLNEILDEPIADEDGQTGAEENAIGDWLTDPALPDIWDLPDGEPNGSVDEAAIAIQADSTLIWGEPNGSLITSETIDAEATFIQDEPEIIDEEATVIQDESGLIWGKPDPAIDARADQDATVIQDDDDLAGLFQVEDSDPSPELATLDPDPLTDIWGLDVEPSPLPGDDPVPEITALEDATLAEALSEGPTPGTNAVETAADTNATTSPLTLDAALQAIGEQYDTLPTPVADAISAPPPTLKAEGAAPVLPRRTIRPKPQTGKPLTARIALDRLERMDNYVGELVINRNGLSLQNEQFQRTVRHLQQRFGTFRTLAKQLQTLSDKILTNPDRVNSAAANLQSSSRGSEVAPSPLLSATQFDALELDTYSAVNLMLEELLEELLQVEESIEDVNLFAGQSNQKLEKQRQLLTRLRDELMWSRMVPLSGVLNRFPRILRELSTAHHKPVQLELKGAEVLVDRVMLEKLYDPLMHLLRNAFDHGIESPEERRQQGKSKQGTIRIRAYHQGNNTVIEVQDNGRGLDLTHIGQRAVEAGLLSPGDLPTTRKQQLYKAIFEPGFSTAAQVSDLSGRGVGLDVVRERLQSFNGKVSVVSEPGQGTTFTLRIPLTLTLAKLIVVRVGNALMALSSDGIEEIVTPLDNQMKASAGQRFLLWRDQLVPTHALEALQPYACAIPEAAPEMPLASRYRAKKPLLMMQREHEALALEVDQIITEQELVIKPFSKSIAAPSYMNGCTVLGDGRLVPVIDAIGVVDYVPKGTQPQIPVSQPPGGPQRSLSPTLLIVDDSAALRRTLALTLQKAGYRVVQAKDGREALDQLQQGRDIQLIICDIEMPRMNGFEFLSQKRLTPALASIPTVMLTSRSSQKHRMLALQLGADSYFSKPYIEADFLSALKTHLKPALSPV